MGGYKYSITGLHFVLPPINSGNLYLETLSTECGIKMRQSKLIVMVSFLGQL
jgi:hypothetical protein